MSDRGFDSELRGRYSRLRAEDRAGMPEFDALLARAQSQVAEEASQRGESGSADIAPIQVGRRRLLGLPSHAARWSLVAGSLAAAALAGVMLLPPSADENFEALVAGFSSDAAGGNWRSPTAGLLDVPGIELVRFLPSIGGTLDLTVDPGGPTG